MVYHIVRLTTIQKKELVILLNHTLSKNLISTENNFTELVDLHNQLKPKTKTKLKMYKQRGVKYVNR